MNMQVEGAGNAQDERATEIASIIAKYPDIKDCFHGTHMAHLAIEVELPSPVRLIVTIPDKIEDLPQVSFLPPVVIDMSLPDGYPAIPPSVRTESAWLPQHYFRELEEVLMRFWREQGGKGAALAFVDYLNRDLEELANDNFVFGTELRDILQVTEADLPTLLEYDIQAKQEEEFKKQDFDCSICIETKPGAECHRMKSCSHVFCTECLQQCYNSCIASGDISKVICVEIGCDSQKNGRPRTIKPSELLAIPLEKAVVDRYVNLKRKKRIESDQTTVYCPVNECSGPSRSKNTVVHENQDSDTDESDIESNVGSITRHATRFNLEDPSTFPPPVERLATCSECDFPFCKVCRNTWHGGSVNCVPGSKPVLTEEEKASEDYLKSNSQSCPNCHAPAQKSRGCNHMICFRCQTNYCFPCGVVIDSKDWAAHYNTLDKGCYNRLWERRPGDDAEDGDEDEEEEEEEEEEGEIEVWIDGIGRMGAYDVLQVIYRAAQVAPYLSRHDYEKVLPLPLVASGVSSGCFKVSQGVSGPERFLS